MTQLLQNAAYGTALILAAAVLRRVLKQRLIPEARLALWAVCLLRLLTPAAPESVLSLWRVFRPRQAPAVSPPISTPAPVPDAPQFYIPAQAVPTPAPVINTAQPYIPAQTVPTPVPPAIPWGKMLLAAWLAVGIALAVRYVVSWTRTRRAVALTIPVERGSPRYLPLPKCARLREGPMEGAPLTFGVARPTVVLTPGLEGDALDCVLVHEGVHARRRDNLWHYAMALALVVHWWNPAVWLMAHLLRRDIELSCDRAALKRLGADKRAQYANTLVSLATQGGSSAFSHAFGRKLTEERIVAIMKYKKMTALGLALSLLLVCGVTVAFATEPVEPAGESPDSVSEPSPVISEPVPAMTEDEELEEILKMLLEFIKEQEEELQHTLEASAVQSDCDHRINYTFDTHAVLYKRQNASTHKRTDIDYYRCNDCNEVFSVNRGSIDESHTFGVGSYVSSNHSAVNPAKHFATYSHTCSNCYGTYSYTLLLGCTQYGCISPQSITPEPDVYDSAPDTSAEPAGYSPDLADMTEEERMAMKELEDAMNDMLNDLLTQVYTAPSTSCGVEGCTVSGEHHHENGEVIHQ